MSTVSTSKVGYQKMCISDGKTETCTQPMPESEIKKVKVFEYLVNSGYVKFRNKPKYNFKPHTLLFERKEEGCSAVGRHIGRLKKEIQSKRETYSSFCSSNTDFTDSLTEVVE